MLKNCVGKGRHVMKQLHTGICLGVLQYYATVATDLERAGYVLYRALVCVCGATILINHEPFELVGERIFYTLQVRTQTII